MDERIIELLKDTNLQLENIAREICFRPEVNFTMKVAHVLTSDLFDDDKLNCIRVLYREFAWPEKELSQKDKDLLAKAHKPA